VIAPEGYTLDAAMIERPGNIDIQLDLFLDYANNVELYPAFQEYFRRSKPPLPPYAARTTRSSFHPAPRAYLRDNPNPTVQFLDTALFALETHVEEIAVAMRQFLTKTTA